ncbi:MAG TPA: aminodeoxychorismate synthase component I [Aromatoleum sp.]|uniref:aminodeoxychorismate synthase component I n=1 Tax=Aromatoleum sp. TaxID=2307007 RepID=UPI002B4A403D|nr:aminodeoxychorismate synthase component I [Aromatoleum sp.]HJV27807.1 aminodeoxychorismate synthase component I [Aromatoleum sp.]
MFDNASCFALFDDNLDGTGDFLLTGLVERVECNDPALLADVLARIETQRKNGHWAALKLRYELGYALEPRLHALLQHDAPLLTAWIFSDCKALGADQTTARIEVSLSALDEHERVAGLAKISPTLSPERYVRAISRIQELIGAGDCYQVNFTFPMQAQAYGSPIALYKALRHAQPVKYGALIRDADGTILSRSPELFVERHGDRLICRPMKGTAPRDGDAEALAGSEKNRAENVMIVDLIRNDLGRLVPAGGVHVERLFDVEAYPSVWQMTSTVTAAPVSAGFEDILRALFPCGSITGAPKIRAMEIIHELEEEPRGIYCGGLGWLAPDGDFRLSVPIRTLEIARSGDARLGIGSGIVADSDAASEWAECLLKGRFATDLKPAFGLIETLRCEGGMPDPYPLLERHLARLQRSAAELGFVFDRQAVCRKLDEAASDLAGTHRVRLELSADGSISVIVVALDPIPLSPLPTVILSQERVSSIDLLQRHKTTARERYDRELRRATAAGHFDVIFLNEDGEVAEGARSTLYLDSGDGHLLTPPLASGVLDGVYRRKLLDEGVAFEKRLTLADLNSADVIHLSNALRGLVPARLVKSQ